MFGKLKPHGGAIRLINDHSTPKGKSFNEGISDEVLRDIHLHMGTLSNVITTILLAGRGAVMSKHDLSEAFQTLPVQLEQLVSQAIRILGCIFIALKCTYGDKQACHRFSRCHETLLRHVIIPTCDVDINAIDMVVDDVTCVTTAAAADTELAQFDKSYRGILGRLGFKTKDPDPHCFKAFQQTQVGEVLGFVLNTRDLTWSFSKEKNDKIIEAIDLVYDLHNVRKRVYVTLKMAQRAVGKLQAISACWDGINPWLIFPDRDIVLYHQNNPEVNKLKESSQPRNFYFSLQARRDIHLLRAILYNIHQQWIPITDPDNTPPVMNDLCVYTDASAKVDGDPAEPGPALGIYIPPQPGAIARAVAFPLPMEFLVASDDVRHNYGNTILLEGLAILACLTRFPTTFAGKTVTFYTDSAGFALIFRRKRTKGHYNAYLLRSLLLVLDRINCKATVKWQRRRSDSHAAAADTLTHQSFSDVHPAVNYRRVEPLPAPIQRTLVTSTNYNCNTFHMLSTRILHYWKLL